MIFLNCVCEPVPFSPRESLKEFLKNSSATGVKKPTVDNFLGMNIFFKTKKEKGRVSSVRDKGREGRKNAPLSRGVRDGVCRRVKIEGGQRKLPFPPVPITASGPRGAQPLVLGTM